MAWHWKIGAAPIEKSSGGLLDCRSNISYTLVVRGFINHFAQETQNPTLYVPLGNKQRDCFGLIPLRLASTSQRFFQFSLMFNNRPHISIYQNYEGRFPRTGSIPIVFHFSRVLFPNVLFSRASPRG